MEKNALGAMENHKKGIVLIIKPIKKALLYAVGIIEFAMILFYINASTLKEILIEFGISLVVIFLVILHPFSPKRTIVWVMANNIFSKTRN